MNYDDYLAEIAYRTHERMGINCGSDKPTTNQLKQINQEVRNDMKRMEFNDVMEGWE